MNDENVKFNANQYNDWWLHRTDEQGRDIWFADALGRLMKDSFVDDVWPRWIDISTVYKWPNLKQTGYKIDANISSIKILGYSGVEFHAEKAIKIEDVKIKFDNNKDSKSVSLIEYVNIKKNSLDIMSWLKLLDPNDLGELSTNEYQIIGSQNVSMLLSCTGSWRIEKRIPSIIGNKNIFESDELLDQLLITILILHARWGSDKAINILLSLLDKRISSFIQIIFKGILNEDFIDKLSESMAFVSRVIMNEDSLADRFRFYPKNSQSLNHFVAGLSVGDNKEKNKWIPKLQEYFGDFMPEYIEEFELSKSTATLDDSIELPDVQRARNSNSQIELTVIKQKMAKWPKREQDIFRLRFEQDMTLEQIGEEFGIGKSYVSQIINRKVKELKKYN